jgi:hypothetical protein
LLETTRSNFIRLACNRVQMPSKSSSVGTCLFEVCFHPAFGLRGMQFCYDILNHSLVRYYAVWTFPMKVSTTFTASRTLQKGNVMSSFCSNTNLNSEHCSSQGCELCMSVWDEEAGLSRQGSKHRVSARRFGVQQRTRIGKEISTRPV